MASDLLLADPTTDSILRFNGDTGASLGAFVNSGAGGLIDPHNPTFGPDGNLYVFSTQTGAQKILKFNGVTGASLGTFVNTGVGGFAGGFGMAFSPTNGDLYVATGGANVLRFDGTSGAFEGLAASGNGIIRASGVEFGPDGNLYVLDSDTRIDSAYDRILRFNPETGAFIDVFVNSGSLEDSISFAFGPDNHIYVPDINPAKNIKSFNGTNGNLQRVFSEGARTLRLFSMWCSARTATCMLPPATKFYASTVKRGNSRMYSSPESAAALSSSRRRRSRIWR
jgi:DNA-binding beta-propeller fold protein YncE